ncbi:MAG: hypothetical protein GXP45_04605 [bacterium]|nr:hypothetical protein [bacterium]
MIGQSAIGNPRVFVGDKPDLEELHYRIIEHLHTMMACELYFQEQIQNIPDKDPNFTLTMFSEAKLQNYIDKAIDIASTTKTKFFSLVEFRKYLFNYVKGIPGSKEFKTQIAVISEYKELKNKIDIFFSN